MYNTKQIDFIKTVVYNYIVLHMPFPKRCLFGSVPVSVCRNRNVILKHVTTVQCQPHLHDTQTNRSRSEFSLDALQIGCGEWIGIAL